MCDTSEAVVSSTIVDDDPVVTDDQPKVKEEQQSDDDDDEVMSSNVNSSTEGSGSNVLAPLHDQNTENSISNETKKKKWTMKIKVESNDMLNTSTGDLNSSNAMNSTDNISEKENEGSSFVEAKSVEQAAIPDMVSEKQLGFGKRNIKRKSWGDDFTTPTTKKNLSAKKPTRGIRPDCPPFCKVTCTFTHHPLLVAVRKVVENDSSSTLVFLEICEKFYGSGSMNPSDQIYDPWKSTNYPLLHYLALMGKCSCTFALSQSGHNPTTTVTCGAFGGDNVLHTLIKEMYIFNCTHGHMDVLAKKFHLLIKEFSDCLKFINNSKETPLHVNARLIFETALSLNDTSRKTVPFRLYQFMKTMFNYCLDYISNIDDCKSLINLQDMNGCTASHYIVQDRASWCFIEKLQEYGADFSIKNNLGKTVRDLQDSAPSPPSDEILELALFSAKSNKARSLARNKPSKYVAPVTAKRIIIKSKKALDAFDGEEKIANANSDNKKAALVKEPKAKITAPGPRIKNTPVKISKKLPEHLRPENNFERVINPLCTMKKENSNEEFTKMISDKLRDTNWKSIEENVNSSSKFTPLIKSTIGNPSNSNTKISTALSSIAVNLNGLESVISNIGASQTTKVLQPPVMNTNVKLPISALLTHSKLSKILPKPPVVINDKQTKKLQVLETKVAADPTSAHPQILSSVVGNNMDAKLTSPISPEDISQRISLNTTTPPNIVRSSMRIASRNTVNISTTSSNQLPTTSKSPQNLLVQSQNGKLVTLNLVQLENQINNAKKSVLSPTAATAVANKLQLQQQLRTRLVAQQQHSLQQQTLQQHPQQANALMPQPIAPRQTPTQIVNQLKINNPQINIQSQQFLTNQMQNVMMPRPMLFMTPDGLRYVIPATSTRTFVSPANSHTPQQSFMSRACMTSPSQTIISPDTIALPSQQTYVLPNANAMSQHLISQSNTFLPPSNIDENTFPTVLNARSLQPRNAMNTMQYRPRLPYNTTPLLNPITNQPFVSVRPNSYYQPVFSTTAQPPMHQSDQINSTGDIGRKAKNLEESINNLIKTGSKKRKSNLSHRIPPLQPESGPPTVIILDSEENSQYCNKELQSPSVESSQDVEMVSDDDARDKTEIEHFMHRYLKEKGSMEDFMKFYNEKRNDLSNKLQEEEKKITILTSSLHKSEMKINNTNKLIEQKEHEIFALRSQMNELHETVSNICNERRRSVECCGKLTKRLKTLDDEVNFSKTETIDKVLNSLI